jgi:hypothetical protein
VSRAEIVHTPMLLGVHHAIGEILVLLKAG